MSGRLWRGQYCFTDFARKQRAPLVHARMTLTSPTGRLYFTDTTAHIRRAYKSLRRRTGCDNRLILIPTQVMNEGCLRSTRARVFLIIVRETGLVVLAKANRDDSRSRGQKLRATIYGVKRAMGDERDDAGNDGCPCWTH